MQDGSLADSVEAGSLGSQAPAAPGGAWLVGALPGRVAGRADSDRLQHPARSELLHCSLWVKAAKQ